MPRQIVPRNLAALLKLLKDSGVTRYQSDGFCIELSPAQSSPVQAKPALTGIAKPDQADDFGEYKKISDIQSINLPPPGRILVPVKP